MTVLEEARERAARFLDRTHYFHALGLDELGADARMLARLLLELADMLEAERSARVALQARCETQQAILGRRADAAITEALAKAPSDRTRRSW